jgi:hypothetical protein
MRCWCALHPPLFSIIFDLAHSGKRKVIDSSTANFKTRGGVRRIFERLPQVKVKKTWRYYHKFLEERA